jgi:hypothetical protein
MHFEVKLNAIRLLSSLKIECKSLLQKRTDLTLHLSRYSSQLCCFVWFNVSYIHGHIINQYLNPLESSLLWSISEPTVIDIKTVGLLCFMKFKTTAGASLRGDTTAPDELRHLSLEWSSNALRHPLLPSIPAPFLSSHFQSPSSSLVRIFSFYEIVHLHKNFASTANRFLNDHEAFNPLLTHTKFIAT